MIKSKCQSKIIPTGTKEWADSNINICSGCKNNCRYCYAKKMAIRFGRKTSETWEQMVLNYSNIEKRYLKRKGRIMFPSSHDITKEILASCITVLKKIVDAKNTVLITTKPQFFCVKQICEKLASYKDKIQFRFTIGSLSDELFKFWEPNAPKFQERFKSLKYAQSQNFKTSISIEPFLDFDPIPLVTKLLPYVTESIWIGKMNYIAINGLSHNEEGYYSNIRKNYTKENIRLIYNHLKEQPKIQWKDSIKKMLKIV